MLKNKELKRMVKRFNKELKAAGFRTEADYYGTITIVNSDIVTMPNGLNKLQPPNYFEKVG